MHVPDVHGFTLYHTVSNPKVLKLQLPCWQYQELAVCATQHFVCPHLPQFNVTLCQFLLYLV